MTANTTSKPATAKQQNFMQKLMAERNADTITNCVVTAGLDPATFDPFGLTTKQCSAFIDALLDAPKAKKNTPAAPYAPTSVVATNLVPGATFTPTGQTPLIPAATLVGEQLAIPYADSAAVVVITAEDDQFVTLEKAHGVNPDDWSHPLIGNGPVRLEKTSPMVKALLNKQQGA
jgi:hypothetical protein